MRLSTERATVTTLPTSKRQADSTGAGPALAPAVALPPQLAARDAPASGAGPGGARIATLPASLEVSHPRWWPRPARVAVLVISDLATLAACCVAAYLVWANAVLGQPWKVYADLAPLLSVFILAYATAGLYPGFGIGAVETLRRLSTRTSFTFLVLAAGSFVLKLPPTYSRVTFALAWAASLVLVPTVRYLVLAMTSRWAWWGEPTVLVGSGRQVERIVRLLRDARSLGYRPVAVLATDPLWTPRGAEPVPVLADIGLAEDLAARGVSVALVVEDGESGAGRAGAWLQQLFPHVVLLHGAEGLPVEGVDVRNLGGVLGIEFRNRLLRWHNRALKRLVDAALGGALLLLALPVIAIAAALVRVFSRGPVFYVQEREGLAGRVIKVRKLRTMRAGAESALAGYLDDHPEERAAWERSFKLRRDPRVVPVVGSFLRRLSIDELPQLWNVLAGDMSLVGPRPFPEYHLARFDRAFRELRRRVRPGITGLWQVMVRSEGGIEEQQAFDTYYIQNWSAWLDAYVLAKTFAAVLGGRGAY